MNENTPKIYGQMVKVMAEVGAIEKTRRNKQGNGYDFRGIDDIYFALQELLAKHEIFMIPEVINIQREERQSASGGVLTTTLLTVKYTYYATDGSFVSCTTTGEGFDSGDKSANKAMSGAQKYAIVQTFCIPTQEKKDSEHESPMLGGNPISATKPTHGKDGSTADTHYLIPFGKFKQRTLEEVGPTELSSYVAYLERNAAKDGKQITGGMADFIARAEEFIGSFEKSLPVNDDIPF